VPPSREPTLYLFHRILIAASAALGLILLAWGVGEYRAGAGTDRLVVGLFGALASVALGLYLRWFLRKSRRDFTKRPPLA